MGQVKAQFRVVWVVSDGGCEIGLQRLTLHTFIAHSMLTHCAESAAAC
jgi:hypothetical protein